MKKPKLKMRNIRIDVQEHGGFGGKLTVQFTLIGIDKSTLVGEDPRLLFNDLPNIFKESLEKIFDVEMVQP